MPGHNFANYKRELERFSFACEKMGESNFITCDPKIAEVLKSIAESDLLCNFMRELTKNFDFTNALQKSRVPSTPDEYMLLLPSDKQEYIAFVFCLLVYIDLGKINFSDFLADYFFDLDGGMNSAYINFCETVILKFKRSVMSIIDGAEDERASDGEPSTGTGEVDTEIYEQLKDYVAEIITATADLKDLSLIKKEEIMIVADSFVMNLESGGKRLVYALFLGLNYTVSAHLPHCEDTLQSIKTVLAKNGLI